MLWQEGLFYKILPRIPFNHWLILYEWYTSLKSVITWNEKIEYLENIRMVSLSEEEQLRYEVKITLEELTKSL
jgi:hypothetical protein